jgi:hypothetical protein
MPQIVLGNDVQLQNGLVVAYREVSASTTITSTSGPNSGHEYSIGVDTDTNAVTVDLPTTLGNGMEVGRVYFIFDKTGNAATNNITVDPGAGTTISGNATLTVSAAYNSVSVMYLSAGVWLVV